MMKSELVTKFKALFEEQKKALVYSNQYLNEVLSDEADIAAAEIEQGMHMRLRNREFLLVRKIEEALSKIKLGTFGTCECCEEDIELSRLEVRPTANLCLKCKEASEINEARSSDGRKSKSFGDKVQLRSA